MKKEIQWQTYERNRTGEHVKFRRQCPGRYVREDGVEFNYPRLRRYYTWINPGNRAKRKQEFEINANGFKVRIK